MGAFNKDGRLIIFSSRGSIGNVTAFQVKRADVRVKMSARFFSVNRAAEYQWDTDSLREVYLKGWRGMKKGVHFHRKHLF